jgi:hypothetical protein
MQIVRKAVAGELARLRTARGLAARAAFIGGCAMFLCATPISRSPRARLMFPMTIASAIRSR